MKTIKLLKNKTGLVYITLTAVDKENKYKITDNEIRPIPLDPTDIELPFEEIKNEWFNTGIIKEYKTFLEKILKTQSTKENVIGSLLGSWYLERKGVDYIQSLTGEIYQLENDVLQRRDKEEKSIKPLMEILQAKRTIKENIKIIGKELLALLEKKDALSFEISEISLAPDHDIIVRNNDAGNDMIINRIDVADGSIRISFDTDYMKNITAYINEKTIDIEKGTISTDEPIPIELINFAMTAIENYKRLKQDINK